MHADRLGDFGREGVDRGAPVPGRCAGCRGNRIEVGSECVKFLVETPPPNPQEEMARQKATAIDAWTGKWNGDNKSSTRERIKFRNLANVLRGRNDPASAIKQDSALRSLCQRRPELASASILEFS
jgi:hypothetical protein